MLTNHVRRRPSPQRITRGDLRSSSGAPAVCGGTPEAGGWADPADERDDEEPLTSLSTQTPLANPPHRGAASKKSGKSGKKSGHKTKRLRADADLQDTLTSTDAPTQPVKRCPAAPLLRAERHVSRPAPYRFRREPRTF